MVEPAGGHPFEVLFVCSGNRFRSPVAAGFLAAYLAPEEISVASAGSRGTRGAPALREAVEFAERLGIDISSHRSREVASLDLRETDLVICFERSHLAAAVVDGGAPAKRAFLFLELLELLDEASAGEFGTGVGRARRLVARAAELRPDRLWPEARFEFPDPLAGPASNYPSILNRLEELCRQLADTLFGRVAQPKSMR